MFFLIQFISSIIVLSLIECLHLKKLSSSGARTKLFYSFSVGMIDTREGDIIRKFIVKNLGMSVRNTVFFSGFVQVYLLSVNWTKCYTKPKYNFWMI